MISIWFSLAACITMTDNVFSILETESLIGTLPSEICQFAYLEDLVLGE